ncbi:MAG: universal stress protein [Actinomycetota bacterium]|nr:universal stress protein [Actinomycetota bacterium]
MSAKPVVVATDGSEESLRAVDWAAREAVLREAPLRIVSAAGLLPRMMERPASPGLETVTDVMSQDRDRALAAAAARAATVSPDLLVDTDRLTGAPAQAVAESGSGAMMLVVGSRGSGAFTALVLGSVSRYAATHAPCPVVVVRDETTATHRQVAVGIGDPETSAAALSFAFEAATLRNASLLAVHAWNTPRSERARALEALATPGARAIQEQLISTLTALLDDWRGKYPNVPVSQDVVYGHPGRALAGLSARADLVVIGRHPGSHGPGAVTHAVLSHAHGPVVSVPSA